MLHALGSTLQAALIERVSLLLNHVLAAEPAASARLRGHAGRSVTLQFDGWPGLLPPLPQVAFRVTPAGLLEACDAKAPSAPDLRLRLEASNPALAFAQWAAGGDRPRLDVQGDAQFAADLSWLMDNLRWDVQDDLARLVGPAPAHELARIARLIAGGLRTALRALAGVATRGGSPSDGPRSAQ